MDQVISAYLTLRDQKRAIEAETKTKLADVSARMDKLEGYIRQQAETQGVNSFKTSAGTAFLSTLDFASVADWDAVLTFVRQNNAFDMLERRVAKAAVRAHIDASGNVPPGVNYGQRIEVSVRKPSAKADD
jgi:hypothetical protein